MYMSLRVQGCSRIDCPKRSTSRRLSTPLTLGNDLNAAYFENQTTEQVIASIPDILDKFVLAIQVIDLLVNLRVKFIRTS